MQIDHYFWINSDWAYLGIDRLLQIGKHHSVEINHKPVDLLQVYQRTGGIPLPQRAAERQAYREQELRRWTKRLNIDLNITPRYMCPDSTLASCFVIAAQALGHPITNLFKKIMAAEWYEELDISDKEVLLKIARNEGLPADEIARHITHSNISKTLQNHTDEAVMNGVFGSPSYLYDGELFWGQDRLEFLDETISFKKTEK